MGCRRQGDREKTNITYVGVLNKRRICRKTDSSPHSLTKNRMKNLLLFLALTLPIGILAQGNANISTEQIQNISFNEQGMSPKKPCSDCDEVKGAIKIFRTSSQAASRKKSFAFRKWSKRIEANIYRNTRKAFPGHRKAKSNFAICFNWK